MKSRAAAKGRRLFFLAAVCLLSALLLSPAAEASRSLPAAIAPALSAPATPDQVLETELTEPPERLRIFDDLSLPPRPLELVEASKTATGSSTYTLGLNIRQTGDLSRESGGLSFQGLWTDPVTGIAYARNRWYDARTASWLSEDPLGAVDSPNLYAFVGWGPHVGRDPMGLAVYAFDGTWNDKDEMLNPTNVAKLYDAADRETPGSNEYLVGVGTNRVSKKPCGLTGCGASARVWRAYQALIRRYNEGDTEIDIFGFSRGAAEAREFANLIYREGIPDYSTGRTRKVYVEGRGVAEVTEYDRVHPDIRFLGLFDTVASMGVPGDDSNPGFDMSIPPNVRNVRQAIATNETRREFPLSSVIDLDNPDDPRIVERSFPGAHSDVGGGYEDNNIASRVPLMWMWEEAIAAGVPLAPLLPEDTNLDSMGYYHDSRKSFDRFRDWLFGLNERGVYHYTNPSPERTHE